LQTGALIGNPAQTKSPIQCMDQAWGMIFIGTKSGHVSRFYIEVNYFFKLHSLLYISEYVDIVIYITSKKERKKEYLCMKKNCI